MQTKTAAIIVVGNEILSGKVVDTNSAFAARELRAAGVSLERIIVIPDDIDVIASAVRDFQAAYDLVFTSGGVGPTHDDVTIAGVARGFAVPVVTHPVLLEAIRRFGHEMTPAQMKMAEVPEGAEAITVGAIRFPVVRMRNVYVLPGIPELFHDKFAALRTEFAGDPYFLRVLYVQVLESAIAPQLNNTLSAFPRLLLGSYPKLGESDYRVRVTLESKDRAYVDEALAHLLALLPRSVVVRIE